MRTPIATTLRLIAGVAVPVGFALYRDSWFPLLAIPILLAVTIFVTAERAASAFTRHPWRASAVHALGSGVCLGFLWLAIGHSRTGSLGYGGSMGVFWFFAFRYSQGPRLVERAEHRASAALTRSPS